MKSSPVKITSEYSPSLMNKYYLIHAGINCFAWFDDYASARKYLFSKWVDSRIATEIFSPVGYN